ncbi:MAG: ACP S-malonyltransferase [Candidatus Omnitrophica bacterium]|nr:ACP S-malonyltransferase [Candidatus Omnitrophota bacterium]
MKHVALIFPGQGAQKVGMGLEFYQTSPQAKAIFDEADSICANGLTKIIFEGPQEKLTSTSYCQPAILTVSIAALKSFEARPQFKNISVKFTAGLSLGEYSALAASGAISFADTLRLVQKRAAFMEEATKEAQGTMAAVIGFDKLKLIEICQKTGAQVANFNSHEQMVITGHAAKVEAAIEAIKAAGGQKIIPLSVSGAFHSSLMASAASRFAPVLKDAAIHPTDIKVITNVNARPQQDADAIRQNLAQQITSSVQWVACVEYMIAQGVTEFIEIGPGKVLKGLVRRINPSVVVHNIETPADIDNQFANII